MEILYLLFILVPVPSCYGTYTCDDEIVQIGGQNVTWAVDETGLVVSDPPCLDENGLFVLRRCNGGVWSKANCASIHNSSKCPTHLMEHAGHCLKIQGPEHFDVPCLYPGIKYLNYSYLNTTGEFWMPIRRKWNNTFMYTSLDKRYGKEFQMNSYNSNKDCFVFRNDSLFPADCDELNYHICAYKPAMLGQKAVQINTTLKLELKFDTKRDKLLLSVHSPRNLMKTMEDDYAVYCFTDAARNELKSRVKKKEVFNSLRKNKKKMQDLIVYQISIKHEDPGQYYCEAYNLNETLINSNILIAFKRKKGNEYALRLILRKLCVDNCSTISSDMIYEFLDKTRFKYIFAESLYHVRVMEIGDRMHDDDVEVLLHLSSQHLIRVVSEYYQLLGRTMRLPLNISVVYLRSCEYCLPETENYVSWKLTVLGNQALPKEFCVDANNVPVTRLCTGNFVKGAYWSRRFKKCEENVDATDKTKELYEIVTNLSANSSEVVKNLTSDVTNIDPIDVYFVANVIHEVQDENILDTLDHILQTNATTLKNSQIYLNATDTILDSIDSFLIEYSDIEDDVMLIQKNNYIIHITKPYLTGINGIAVYNNNEQINTYNMMLNETFDDLEETNLQLSVQVPLELLETLIKEGDDTANLTVITTIFHQDKLFNSEQGQKTGGKVVSVTIPDYGIFLEEPIPILFRTDNNTNLQCGFWEYGQNSPNKTGRWASSGSNLLNSSDEYTQCTFNHLTHFALLIMSQKIVADNDDCIEYDEPIPQNSYDYLSIITIIGCVISLLGLLGIFLTAVRFPKWRIKVGRKILLQLSLTIFLELIIMYMADSDYFTDKNLRCTIIGVCLHYVELAKFSWMFVSAILQYIRFVKVLAVLPPRLILKTVLFGWGMPIIPVILVVCFFHTDYSSGPQKFCYPTGMSLYLGLFAPIVLIVFANLVVFTLIMRNVFRQQIEGHSKSKKSQKLQIYLGILLFFMFGVPWVFGIMAEILTTSTLKLVFVYLFCLTATLQGAVLFVFYVILDPETNKLWLRSFKKSQ